MTRLRASEIEFVRPSGLPEDSVVSVFRVPPEVAGQRLDVFLCGQLHRSSRTRTQAIVRASAYDAAGRRLKPNDRVRAEQSILLWRAPWDETPAPIEVPVLYEDGHLLAVDKPALLAVHPTARYHRNTLIKILQSARPDCAFLSLGHRLDRETSGVLLVSKTRACDRALKKQLARREGVKKSYIAITWGTPDRGDGAVSFRYERRMELDTGSPLGVKMRVRDAPDALEASTLIDVADVRTGSGRAYSLVRCGLETGRQHQIRLHLATLGAPVVGDKLYGPDDRAFARAADGELTTEDASRLELPRHALHAARIELPHPITGEPLAVEARLPPDMRDFWAALGPGSTRAATAF
ncbi:MAG: RluA family pseudouridine synthase [Polyangiaceae bacterium]|jgi:23S rRNA pseudouridine1911/1915/1917 synthase